MRKVTRNISHRSRKLLKNTFYITGIMFGLGEIIEVMMLEPSYIILPQNIAREIFDLNIEVSWMVEKSNRIKTWWDLSCSSSRKLRTAPNSASGCRDELDYFIWWTILMNQSPFFAIRVVSLDWVMIKPHPELDICWSAFEGRECREVPLVRIYGSTPSGQKCCLNLHKGTIKLFFEFPDFLAFPYFFLLLPLYLTTKPEIHHFIHKLAASIDRAMDVSFGKKKVNSNPIFSS